MGIEGPYLNIIKVIHDKTTVNSILATFIQHSIGNPSHSNQEMKGIQFGREEVKLSLFTGDMILHIENPQDATKKLLELINEFEKVAGYKINIQKSAILYTNNKLSEKLRKQSHLQLHRKE